MATSRISRPDASHILKLPFSKNPDLKCPSLLLEPPRLKFLQIQDQWFSSSNLEKLLIPFQGSFSTLQFTLYHNAKVSLLLIVQAD